MAKLRQTTRLTSTLFAALIAAGCSSLTGVDPEFSEGTDTSQLSAATTPDEQPSITAAVDGGGTMVVGDDGAVVTPEPTEGDEAAPLSDPNSFTRQALVPAASFPGYQVLDGGATANAEACNQTQAVIVAHPPTEFAADDISGSHNLNQLVARYPSAEAATAALNYLEGLVAACDAQFASSNVTDDSEIFAEPLPPVALDGADQVTGGLYTLVTRDATVYLDLYGAVVGDVLVMARSTDPESAETLIGALVDRISGTGWEGAIEPDGVLEPGPGYASPGFWSLPDDGPPLVREDVTNPTAGSWLASLDDARVDQFASNACAAMYLYDDSGPVANTIRNTVNTFDGSSLDDASAGDGFSAALGVYCPTLADKLAEAQ